MMCAQYDDSCGMADTSSAFYQIHLDELVQAMQQRLLCNRSDDAATLRRIPKYRSLLWKLHHVPAAAVSFDLNEHLHLIINTLANRRRELQGSTLTACSSHVDTIVRTSEYYCEQQRVLLLFAEEDAQVGHSIQEQLSLAAASELDVIAMDCGSAEWFAVAATLSERDACVVLLSEHFVRSWKCEGCFTFVTDHGKWRVGVVIGYQSFKHSLSQDSSQVMIRTVVNRSMSH